VTVNNGYERTHGYTTASRELQRTVGDGGKREVAGVEREERNHHNCDVISEVREG